MVNGYTFRGTNFQYHFHAPLKIVRGYYVLSLSVCLSVAPKFNAAYQVCVINSSHSFLAINLKLCTDSASILEVCIRLFEEEKITFDQITAFSTEGNFEVRLQYRVPS